MMIRLCDKIHFLEKTHKRLELIDNQMINLNSTLGGSL